MNIIYRACLIIIFCVSGVLTQSSILPRNLTPEENRILPTYQGTSFPGRNDQSPALWGKDPGRMGRIAGHNDYLDFFSLNSGPDCRIQTAGMYRLHCMQRLQHRQILPGAGRHYSNPNISPHHSIQSGSEITAPGPLTPPAVILSISSTGSTIVPAPMMT